MKRESEYRYAKLANVLREQILSGFIKPGEFLMSEGDLCSYYAVSRTSVRKSLEQLQNEGLVIKKVGKGTMVTNGLDFPKSNKKVLRIIAPTPSYFIDSCMDILVERFGVRHPEIEIKILNVSAEDFWESIQRSQEKGIHPDLILTSDKLMSQAPEDQTFVDLEETRALPLKSIYPKLLKAFRKDGRLNAVPVFFSTVFLAYNPRLFERHGVPFPTLDWTTEDFLRAAQKLTLDTNGDGIIDQYGFTFSPVYSRWPVFALQQGVPFKDLLGFKEKMVETLTFLHDLLYRYRVTVMSPLSMLNSELFFRWKAAMVLTTSIELSGWREDRQSFEPGVAKLPLGNSDSTLLMANSFMIPEGSLNRELAARFIEIALDPEAQLDVGGRTKFLSVLPSVNESLMDEQARLTLQIERSQVENSFFLHELIDDIGLMEEWEAELRMFWSGVETAQEVASNLTDILADYLTRKPVLDD